MVAEADVGARLAITGELAKEDGGDDDNDDAVVVMETVGEVKGNGGDLLELGDEWPDKGLLSMK